MSMVGPSESGKTQLIYKKLTSRTYQAKLDKVYCFHHYYQLRDHTTQKRTSYIVFVKGVIFHLIDFLRNSQKNTSSILAFLVRKSAIPKNLAKSPLLEDTVGLTKFTFNSTCSTRELSDAILSYSYTYCFFEVTLGFYANKYTFLDLP